MLAMAFYCQPASKLRAVEGPSSAPGTERTISGDPATPEGSAEKAHLLITRPNFALFWGLVVTSIPACQALPSIWRERHRDAFTKRWAILTGVLRLASLTCLMTYASSRADRA